MIPSSSVILKIRINPQIFANTHLSCNTFEVICIDKDEIKIVGNNHYVLNTFCV